MSRIGNLPIQIPNGVTVEKIGGLLVANGPKGNLTVSLNPDIKVEVTEGLITVTRKNESKKVKSLHGLIRSLIANNIEGVNNGWAKTVELVGVGFRVAGSSEKVTLNIGFSHPVEVVAPEGITFEIKDNNKITISGIDKYLVGQVAANIKAVRKPDAYKGKGIRYQGEYIRKKPGKAGKVGAK